MPHFPRVSDLLHTATITPEANSLQVQETVTRQTQATLARSIQETHIQTEITTQTAPQHSAPRTRVQAEVDATTVKTVAQDGTSTILSTVHATIAGVSDIEMTPPHPPREDTPIYMRTHRHLIFTKDRPCVICGVRKSTLHDPSQNPFGAKDLETHHHPLERCLLSACDPAKVGRVFPQVKDRATMEEFVDSEMNMLVLCDIHHRHPLFGIHHIVGPDFFAQPFVYDGYQVIADKEHEAAIAAADQKIVEAHLTAQEIASGEGTAHRARTPAHSMR